MNSTRPNSPANRTVRCKASGYAIGNLIHEVLSALGRGGAAAKRPLPILFPLLAVIVFTGAAGVADAQEAGRISGRAYLETDGNRGWNQGVDVPLSGVAISLCPGSDTRCTYNPIKSVTTDSAGFYEFTSLAAANYVVLLNATETRLYRLSINGKKTRLLVTRSLLSKPVRI